MKKLAFMEVAPTIHKVGGSEFKFYPISTGTYPLIKDAIKPIARVVATLMTDTSGDNQKTHRAIVSAEDPEKQDTETIIDGIRPDLAALRHTQKMAAMDEFVDTITKRENLLLLAQIVIDSLREDFPPGNADNPKPDEFLRELPLVSVPELAVGVFKANKGLFGPLVERVEALAAHATKTIVERAESRLNNSINGSSSKTTSSGAPEGSVAPPHSPTS